MSDFPKGGDVKDTRAWLDKYNFVEVFVEDWTADAILGLEQSQLLSMVPGERGMRLCGLLKTAKETSTGNHLQLLYPFLYLFTIFFVYHRVLTLIARKKTFYCPLLIYGRE